MKIKNIIQLRQYIADNSFFSPATINNVISALGFSLNGSWDSLKELSAEFENCAEYGASGGFSGFIYYSETIAFFKANRQDIISHMEQTASELGTDLISMIREFGVFRYSEKPTADEVGKALWDTRKTHPELTSLYNVFAWYALEEVSRTWYRYLEENPGYKTELAA
jgi:ABC-type long-subunit fatty acid transport system fused permease/ATPase subunit